MNITTILRILNWIEDVRIGEIIESPGYARDYFANYAGTDEGISIEELDWICSSINTILKSVKHPLRICWVAGEIRPVKDKYRIQVLDS